MKNEMLANCRNKYENKQQNKKLSMQNGNGDSFPVRKTTSFAFKCLQSHCTQTYAY